MNLEALSQGFQGTVAAVPLRFRFRLGLVLVAIVTVLLPLIYLAVVASAGYGVYFHLTNNLWLLEGRGSYLVRGILYAGPAVVGGVLVFFMWKPLLARPAHVQTGVTIERADAPLLFELVERIRGAVRAPAPRALVLDSEVNASASFRRGLTSFARRDDLTLTIGLPLVAGLDIRQLSGVLAHELGHFAQGSSMRLTYLIRTRERLAGPRRLRSRQLGRMAGERGEGVGLADRHRAAHGALHRVADAQAAGGAGDAGARDRDVHAARDGVRRRSLRSGRRRQRCLRVDCPAHARAVGRAAAGDRHLVARVA